GVDAELQALVVHVVGHVLDAVREPDRVRYQVAVAVPRGQRPAVVDVDVLVAGILQARGDERVRHAQDEGLVEGGGAPGRVPVVEAHRGRTDQAVLQRGSGLGLYHDSHQRRQRQHGHGGEDSTHGFPYPMRMRSRLGPPLDVVAVRRIVLLPALSATGSITSSQLSQVAVPGNDCPLRTVVPLTVMSIGRSVVVPFAYRTVRVVVAAVAELTV